MGKVDGLQNTWPLSFDIDGRAGEGGIHSVNIYWVSITCQALFEEMGVQSEQNITTVHRPFFKPCVESRTEPHTDMLASLSTSGQSTKRHP